jgi:thioredoxin reductase
VAIVGGGPAGLSAALLLGRCRRRVLLVDDGRPRNGASHAAHAVFTRDGENPYELRRVAREQLAQYDVSIREGTITQVERRPDGGGFALSSATGERHHAKKLLLATGIVDVLPTIPGLQELYGRSAFQCPYCDGWEVRDRRLAVLARGTAGVEYALGITTWSADVVLCTDGWIRLSRAHHAKLQLYGITWRRERVTALEHEDGQLRRIRFEDGRGLSRDALFVHTSTRQRASFASGLDCALTKGGSIKTRKLASAGRGVYVAGDAGREVHLVTVAAAEGLKAAMAINRELREDALDCARAPTPRGAAAEQNEPSGEEPARGQVLQ